MNLQNIEKRPPKTELPSEASRRGLRPGDQAEVIAVWPELVEPLDDELDTEHLWLTVTQVSKAGRYTGTLNTSAREVPYRRGAQVHFGPEHVANITHDPANLTPTQRRLHR